MSAAAAPADAYAQARFEVRLGGGIRVFRIGVGNAGNDRALQRAGCKRQWHILTPCNPRSRRLGAAQNGARLAACRRRVRACGWRHAASLACADDGSWPEPGFCLFDVEHRSVLALARRYRQHAIVGAKLGAVPRLLWTTPAALRRPERAWHRCARDHDPARCDRGSPA